MKALLLAVTLVLPSAAVAQAPVPPEWFGTWTLNLARSVYVPGPPPYRRASYTIEPAGAGLKVVYDLVLPRGGVNHLEWMGQLDGRDYPVHGVGEMVTYAYRPSGDGYEVVVKLDGRVTATSMVHLSTDGATMTTTTEGRDAGGRVVRTSTVYERRTTPP